MGCPPSSQRGSLRRHGLPWPIFADGKNVYVRESSQAERRKGGRQVSEFGRKRVGLGIRILAGRLPRTRRRAEGGSRRPSGAWDLPRLGGQQQGRLLPLQRPRRHKAPAKSREPARENRQAKRSAQDCGRLRGFTQIPAVTRRPALRESCARLSGYTTPPPARIRGGKHSRPCRLVFQRARQPQPRGDGSRREARALLWRDAGEYSRGAPPSCHTMRNRNKTSWRVEFSAAISVGRFTILNISRSLGKAMSLKSLVSFGKTLLLIAVLFGLALAPTGAASAQGAAPGPCDVFAPMTPCVAAYSTTRALFRDYTGPLYQVTRKADDTSMNVGLLPDGYADAATQDRFCAASICTISKIYDQSPSHNDLTPAPPGGAARGFGSLGFDFPAVANALPVTVHGHSVYGIAIGPGLGYRDDKAVGTAVNGQPEGVYMVTSAMHVNPRCCFDFGNAEVNNLDNNAGHMDAINISRRCPDQTPCKPMAGLDMENGIYGHLPVPADATFVTVMGANDGQHSYAIYQGNAESGSLTTTGMIPLPNGGYQPMQQEGAIILGIGGDNSNHGRGYFFEGVMTKGMPSASVMNEVQKNVVAAGYSGKLHK